MRTCILTLVLVLLAVGCQSSSSQKAQATQRWNTTRAKVLYSLARGQLESGNFDKSRQTINEALQLDPSLPELRILSAKLAIEQGQLELAEKELGLVSGNDSMCAEAAYMRGVVMERWQRPQEAMDAYSLAAQKNPSEPAYLLARAETLVCLGRTQEALDSLEGRLADFEHNAAMRDAIGELQVQLGKYPEAVQMLRRAHVLAPDDVSIWEHYALALYYSANYRQAGDELSRLLKQEAMAKRADLWVAIGQCRLNTGQVREAREHFQEASELDPGSVPVWLSQARAAMQMHDLRRAELSVAKALALDGQSSDAQLMLGYLRLRQERLNEALSAFTKASALDRTDPVSLCMMGYVLQKMDKKRQAASYYAKALQVHPDDELARQLLAGVQLEQQ